MDNENTVLSQFVPGFRANLNLAPQQTDTRLLSAVDSELNYSEPGEMFNADDVGVTDPEDVDTRVADTPDKFNSMSRRVGFFKEFQDSDWFDNVDKAKQLVDPTNTRMAALMAGRWRKVDNKIIEALLGDAYEKVDNTSAPSAVALPAAQLVDADDQTMAHQDETVPAPGTDYGLSTGKLIKARMLLDDSDLEGERYITVGPQQIADLLRTTPVTSQYYNEVKALQTGGLDQFLGFKIIRLPRKRLLLEAGTTNRRCVAWIKPALVYKGRPITNARIAIRHDKSDTPQAFYKTSHGAVRRYDAGVVEIRCKE